MQKFLAKTSFYLHFRDTPKNGEGSKWDVDNICVRVTKHTSKKVVKVEGNLDWLWTIDYGLLWLYIHTHERCSLFDANFVTIFMIFLFLAAPVPRVRRAWNLMGTSVRDGPRLFLLFGKNYCFIQKLNFLLNTLLGNVFQTSGVTGLIMQLHRKIWC